MKRLGVFGNTTIELEKSLTSMAVNVQPVAVPHPVATRGVGLAAVPEYSRSRSKRVDAFRHERDVRLQVQEAIQRKSAEPPSIKDTLTCDYEFVEIPTSSLNHSLDH